MVDQQEQSDEPLAALIALGDQDAFGELFARYAGRVHAQCARLLADPIGAEDLTAIVFMQAWRRRTSLRLVNGRLIAWLLLTATNVCRNENRARRRWRRMLERLPQPSNEPDVAEYLFGDPLSPELGAAVRVAWMRLGHKDRQVVGLCLIGGLSYAEAAEAMGLSHAAIRSRLARARSQLRSDISSASAEARSERVGSHDGAS